MGFRIETASEVTDELVAAFARLIPQLSSASPPTADEFETILGHDANTVFVARLDDGTIVGTLTLAIFPIPTGRRAWIEDVVVDESASGQGIGKALNRAALEHARAAGCRTVELTSRPSREAANHVYLSLGFQVRDTNVYRFELEARDPGT